MLNDVKNIVSKSFKTQDWVLKSLPFPKQKILDSSKLKEF